MKTFFEHACLQQNIHVIYKNKKRIFKGKVTFTLEKKRYVDIYQQMVFI